MITALIVALILWAIVGLGVFIALCEANRLPSIDRNKNLITGAVCGPIAWVVGSVILAYLTLEKWLKE